MSCLKPIVMRNPRYTKLLKTPGKFQRYIKDHFFVDGVPSDRLLWNLDHNVGPVGFLPPDFKIQIPCGKCLECRKKHRLSWESRIIDEIFQHKKNCFVTLTLDDHYLEKFKDDSKRPLKLYIDRLRKALGYRPRYVFTSELGEESGRLHYHGILFDTDIDKIPYCLMRDRWKYGISYISGDVTPKTARYVTKYILKPHPDYKGFVMCSNGIGRSYCNGRNMRWHLNQFDYRPFRQLDGRWYPLAKYCADKMFDEDMRFILMMNRTLKDRWYLRGVEYNSEYDYLRDRDRWYRKTLQLDLSKHLTFKNNGKFHFSETGYTQSEIFVERSLFDEENNLRSWCLDSYFDEGHSAGRQNYYQLGLFDRVASDDRSMP